MSKPRLRFKEFNGEWDSIPLGKITETITSGSRDWAQYYSKDGSKFIRMTNLSRDGINLKLDDLKFVNVKSNSTDGNRTSLIHGDILISITAELGKIGWIHPGFGEAFINQHTALVRINKAKANSKYVAYLLSTPKLNKQINRKNDAGAKSGLNLPTIKSIKILLPELNEQTKIANFLTAVDEKITQLTQKCDLLAQYKKGVMQQIFSQELRFKDDGQDFPDWEEKSMGELCSTFKSGSGITSEKIYEQGVYPVFGGNGLRGYTATFTHDGFYVLIGRQGALCGNINRSYGKAYISEHAIAVQANENSDTEWLAQKLELLKLNRLSESSAQPGLAVNKLIKLQLIAPTKPEQTKIANFLTAIDDKINNAQAQLAAVKQYKQGLLQQMFV